MGKAVWLCETVKSRTLSGLSNQHASVDELGFILLNKMITGHGKHKGLLFQQSNCNCCIIHIPRDISFKAALVVVSLIT